MHTRLASYLMIFFLPLFPKKTFGDKWYCSMSFTPPPARFSGNISPMTESFKIKFFLPIVRSYLCIQSSPTLTKLCWIKCDLVNRISLEKCQKLQYLCHRWPLSNKISHADAKYVSKVHWPLINLILKIQDGIPPIQ